jgi:hypothetical protein
VGALLAVVVTILVVAFSWPAARSEPTDVPIGVAGPGPAVEQVAGQLDEAAPGAFDVTAMTDESAARSAIEDRDVYGAIVLDPAGPPRVLTASAASPVVAQLLADVATRIGPGTPVEDVVPLPSDDPRGAGLSSGTFPIVIGGLAVATAMVLAVRGVWSRLGGALVAAAVAGTAIAWVLHVWLGSLAGDYWVEAGVIALVVAAIAVTLIGLESVLGRPGLGLGAVIMLFLGNPLSGMTTAPEFLPEGWGSFGQALPPGAGGSLLRSVAFFDGAGGATPLLVLAAWLAGGVLLVMVGAMLERRRTVSAAGQPAPDQFRTPA